MAGLRTRVDAWGPPPLERMTRLFFEMNAEDIGARTADERRVPFPPLVRAHELTQAGPVMRDDNVEVTAALVPHPPMAKAFAYRFDAADRSIVISGDTIRSDDLVRLARSADILVHEALYPEGIDRLVAPVGNAGDLRRSILSHHTSVEDAGRVWRRRPESAPWCCRIWSRRRTPPSPSGCGSRRPAVISGAASSSGETCWSYDALHAALGDEAGR
jgi:hypothetical protein